MNREIKFRAWDESQKYMSYQGTSDLKTIRDFMLHFGDDKIMQYTGLKDKNGKEIYEGDIIDSGVIYEVKYMEFLRNVQNSELWRSKVIGNIYENPELLSA